MVLLAVFIELPPLVLSYLLLLFSVGRVTPLPGGLLKKSCVHLGVFSEEGLELVEEKAVVLFQYLRFSVFLCSLDGLGNCLVEVLLAQALIHIAQKNCVFVHLATLLDELHSVGIVTIKDYLHSVGLTTVLSDVEAQTIFDGYHVLCTCHHYELMTSELIVDCCCDCCHFLMPLIGCRPVLSWFIYYF